MLFFWLGVISVSLFWNISDNRQHQYQKDLQTGRAFFQEIQIIRLWNANHGGVYVPITGETQPNPYLKDPLRDVTTTDGLKLTKINPAFMTRMISEIAKELGGVNFHITSLKPIRPANKPTPWESESLTQFETIKLKEAHRYLNQDDGSRTFQYMAPLIAKAVCLKCHAKHGYREGDIRGGISVTLPPQKNGTITGLLITHVAIALAGFLMTLYLGLRLDAAMRSLQNAAHTLRRKVRERTRDLEIAKNRAEQANLQKNAFLANVSHELHTPLNTILGMSDSLLKEELSAEHRSSVTRVNKAGKKLFGKIRSLLDLTRFEGHEVKLKHEPFEIRKVINSVVSEISKAAKEKGLEVRTEISEGMPILLLGDADRLKRVLLSLIDNSVKFTSKGFVSLKASLKDESDGKCSVNITISDSGIGMSKEEQEMLFQEFIQLDSKLNRAHEGLGIELALCKKYVLLMGGSITVDSKPGEGATITVELEMDIEQAGAGIEAEPEVISTDEAVVKKNRDLSGSEKEVIKSLLNSLAEMLEHDFPSALDHLVSIKSYTHNTALHKAVDELDDKLAVFDLDAARSLIDDLVSKLEIEGTQENSNG